MKHINWGMILPVLSVVILLMLFKEIPQDDRMDQQQAQIDKLLSIPVQAAFTIGDCDSNVYGYPERYIEKDSAWVPATLGWWLGLTKPNIAYSTRIRTITQTARMDSMQVQIDALRYSVDSLVEQRRIDDVCRRNGVKIP